MVNSSEVKVACPLVSFFFAHLGASLGASRAFLPLVGNFVFEGSSYVLCWVICFLCFANQLIGLRV